MYNVEREEYMEAYRRTFVTTIESKLRAFQLKLLHNILFTNSRLYKMKIVETDRCTLCKTELETVPHLLYECTHTQDLWNRVTNTWFRKVGIHSLSEKDRMFGLTTGNYEKFLNHIILAAKFYIYKCRVIEAKVVFTEFRIFLRHTEMIESKIAEAKGKLIKHNQKWNLLEVD